MITVKVKVTTIKQEGDFTIVVFELLDYKNNFERYIMVTVPPNWEMDDLKIDEVGYLTYHNAFSGESYYDNKTESIQTYRYTTLWFQSFISEGSTEKNRINKLL